LTRITFDTKIPTGFYWFNEAKHHVDHGLVMETAADTDFWQRTHYGFQRDNGHCLLTKLTGDFSFSTHVTFSPHTMYDQCGLMVRIDRENWLKVSIEYENTAISRLGSVVTNLGYSDWATTDIASEIQAMWYRISKKGSDFLLENATDGVNWQQMRIAHFHKQAEALEVGVYACSPEESSFTATIHEIVIDENQWV
jgi:regulation of enolase protein 1 (concanavalin A-like superfamily)